MCVFSVREKNFYVLTFICVYVLFRSPPIMGVDGPVFPSNANKFGTVRMKPFQSQEQINQQFTYPSE